MKLVEWPLIDETDRKHINEVIDSNCFVKGPYAKKLSEKFSEYIGVPYCLTVSSCTHAIHLALKSLGIGEGDEVLVPNLTYCGTVSPIINAGATPVFVDVDEKTYNIDPNDASRKRTEKTKAVIPVHLHGYPCNVHDIREILPDLYIIEDACQAHGTRRNGEFAGSWGEISCFSLNQVKPLSGGQGGLVVTKDESIYERLIEYASPGKNATVGFSYEITELSAVLALSQLEKLESFIEKAQTNYNIFHSSLNDHLKRCIQCCEKGVNSCWHKMRINVGREYLQLYLEKIHKHGIPFETWPGTLVSGRSEYSIFTAFTPISFEIMQSSFVIGNEKYPFHIQNEDTIRLWAKILNEIHIQIKEPYER